MTASLFPTGSDSPVRAASCARRLMLSMSLPSAGTRSPVSSLTMSPGTRSRAEISVRRPSRIALTVGTASFFRAAIACSARYSWLKPMIALSTTMARMMMTSSISPRNAEAAAATIRMMTMRSLNCSTKIVRGLFLPFSTNSFGPCSARSLEAASVVSPVSTDVSKWRNTSAVSSLYQSLIDAKSFALCQVRQKVAVGRVFMFPRRNVARSYS